MGLAAPAARALRFVWVTEVIAMAVSPEVRSSAIARRSSERPFTT